MNNKPTEELPETPGHISPVAKTTLIEAAGKLIDAATVIALTTAALYFWGHVYYKAFCERLKMPFHGISLPLEDYLVVSWRAVFFLLCLVAAGLIALQLGVASLKIFPRKSAVKSPAEPWVFLRLAGGVLLAAGVLVVGALFMISQADDAADKIVEQSTAVLIRDGNGKPIDGHFVYLRDFGSALLVAEMSSDGNRIVARRLLKASSYSGYSLIAPATPLELLSR